MFEALKERKIIKKINECTTFHGLKLVIDKYGIEILDSYKLFTVLLKRCIANNIYPLNNEIVMKKGLSKYYKELEKNNYDLLLKLCESDRIEFFDFFIYRDLFAQLSKELRQKIICNEHYGDIHTSKITGEFVTNDDLIETYQKNEKLVNMLISRLETGSKEDLIYILSKDELIALFTPYEKICEVVNDLKLSPSTVIKLYEKNPEIITYFQKDFDVLTEIVKVNPEKIQEVLKFFNQEEIIEFYNSKKEFFNSLFLERPELLSSNTFLISYILINNPDIVIQLMNLHFYQENKNQVSNFSMDFFLGYDVFKEMLTNQGVDNFIEFIKFYPLFGATEKHFGAGDLYYSPYGEKQMFKGVHYSLDQNQTISIDDAYKLISIDINYLFNIYNYWQDWGFLEQNKEPMKEQVRQLLQKSLNENNMIDKNQELTKLVDLVFEHITEREVLSEKQSYQSFSIYKYEVIKLLFNKEIIASNSIEDIKSYIQSCYSKEGSNQELFYKIFENAYGSKALEIIKSRPGLNPFTITSFEIFRPQVINNFKEGFIHDLLSYNIKGFTNFLMITKNEDDLNLFKDYYECLTKIFGENVVTMEKSFMNFYYYKDLVKNIQNVDLTNEEQQNLISVLSGNYNNYNIKTLEDLREYNQIANKNLLTMISKARTAVEIKNIICNDLLGVDYNVIEETYKFAIEQLSMRGFSYLIDDRLDESEKNIMEFLNFICKRDLTTEQLQEFIDNVLETNNVRNPKSCVSLLNKIREFEIEKVNESLLTDEKIDAFVKGGLLVPKQSIDGVKVYCYTEKSRDRVINETLQHHTPLDRDKMTKLEPDNGVSTYSTWFKPGIIDRSHESVYFYRLPSDTQIVASKAFNGGDGNTSKYAKNVHSKGEKRGMCFGDRGMYEWASGGLNPEIAFYRRHRDHSNVTNQNHGGVIAPNCFFELTEANIEIAKEYGGIIICSYDEYYDYMQKLNNEKGVNSL